MYGPDGSAIPIDFDLVHDIFDNTEDNFDNEQQVPEKKSLTDLFQVRAGSSKSELRIKKMC